MLCLACLHHMAGTAVTHTTGQLVVYYHPTTERSQITYGFLEIHYSAHVCMCLCD